ncbi:hypothetical protein [Acinetobacter sp. CWB-B33]|uniref:hypothetical protein n=1 Tax=Acinetobacter sp. CWB-B33 TaxID=2815724 RepID=UPI0031FE6A39
MHSKTKAKAKIIGLGLISGLMSAAAMAEPPIQPGDTLQSLSQVKITTTVNGQQGSIQELVASGQVRIADAAAQQASIALGEPAPAGAQPLDAAQANEAAVEQASADAMAPAELNNTQVANAHLGADQANPAAAQDAQSALNLEPAETEMQAPANTAAAAPILSSSSAAPVNAEAPANSDSMSGAAPELPDANAAAEAAPETPVADAAIQASPEAPQAPAEAIAQ